ncbi:MAG: alpha/beta fold hydrolase [Acetobacter persici]|uniref:RBBP9/YdeN family alpha/beta hydrolase n=1 Tax=Acetobacter persici TaxID=1076596 RepID=UPI0039EAA88E
MIPDFSSKQFVIVHGYMASPEAHWFPWLKAQLEQAGAAVHVPALPCSQNPDPQLWAETLETVLPHLNERTVLIGHSLGCVTLLRHVLSRPEGETLGGYVLVSGFDQPLQTLPQLDAFTARPLDYADLQRRAAFRASVFSDNDQIVAPQLSRALAAALETTTLQVPGGGHFLGREGYEQFPALLDLLRRA